MPSSTLLRTAPAKLNLGLHVLRKRSDGFHDLETVFVRIPWADTITAAPAPVLSLTCSDPTLPTDERNLCLHAARLLADTLDTAQGAALRLEKHVPYGAGLGGGSSDAAATLRLLSALWDVDVPEAALHALAADLGSDVPFFLGPSAAYGEGRGERLTPLRDVGGTAYRLPFPLVVVVPPVAVPTADAYRRITPNDDARPDLRALVMSNDLARWRRDLVNDFDAPIAAAYPIIAEVKQMLAQAGAAYVSLSGSGSAVFGVFESDALALAATEAARRAGHRVWHGYASAD